MGLSVVGAGLAISVAVVTGRTLWLVAGLAVMSAMLVGIYNWRWSMYGLLFFMPFSGLPTIAAYPP